MSFATVAGSDVRFGTFIKRGSVFARLWEVCFSSVVDQVGRGFLPQAQAVLHRGKLALVKASVSHCLSDGVSMPLRPAR